MGIKTKWAKLISVSQNKLQVVKDFKTVYENSCEGALVKNKKKSMRQLLNTNLHKTKVRLFFRLRIWFCLVVNVFCKIEQEFNLSFDRFTRRERCEPSLSEPEVKSCFCRPIRRI